MLCSSCSDVAFIHFQGAKGPGSAPAWFHVLSHAAFDGWLGQTRPGQQQEVVRQPIFTP